MNWNRFGKRMADLGHDLAFWLCAAVAGYFVAAIVHVVPLP
jgi:hypothetical protein